jgi:hypothetical protein
MSPDIRIFISIAVDALVLGAFGRYVHLRVGAWVRKNVAVAIAPEEDQPERVSSWKALDIEAQVPRFVTNAGASALIVFSGYFPGPFDAIALTIGITIFVALLALEIALSSAERQM